MSIVQGIRKCSCPQGSAMSYDFALSASEPRWEKQVSRIEPIQRPCHLLLGPGH